MTFYNLDHKTFETDFNKPPLEQGRERYIYVIISFCTYSM